MVKSKFTFEKRQRERVRQQKQKEKAARRMEAKQQKANTEPGVPGKDTDIADLRPGSQSCAENGDNKEG